MIRLIFITVVTIFILLTSCTHSDNITDGSILTNAALKTNDSLLSRHPLLTWIRKTPVEIGCMLEKEFSYRDSVFNCDHKNYVNNGDPCKNTDEYYQGIKFPNELASKINHLFKEISFDFEHGNLRVMQITFQDSLMKDQIIRMLNLPITKTDFPENVIDITYGENIFYKEKPVNPKYTKWLTITGFDHMGAGDVDCDKK